jgi:hypothetical protein
VEDARSTRKDVDDLLRRHRSGDSVVERLESLCGAMTEDLALLGTVVTLMPSNEAHAISAASSAVSRHVEETQFGLGEGPTCDAFAVRRPVLIADLDRLGVRRWPGWAPAALEAGVRAVYAFPLQVGASIFGVLTAYLDSGPRLAARRLERALVFSEVATELLLDGSMVDGGHQLEPLLDATLGTDAHIYWLGCEHWPGRPVRTCPSSRRRYWMGGRCPPVIPVDVDVAVPPDEL